MLSADRDYIAIFFIALAISMCFAITQVITRQLKSYINKVLRNNAPPIICDSFRESSPSNSQGGLSLEIRPGANIPGRGHFV